MTAATAGVHQLCICADDFGMSQGINAAVLDLIEQEKLGATSCLVQREAWDAGARALRRVARERVDVGLHLDLTPPAFPGGEEPGLGPLMWRTFTRTASRRLLRQTIADQLSLFEEGMGRAPAFVDGHRHVHQLPVVRDLLMEELVRRYAGSLPWLRSTRPRATQGKDAFKAHLIHALGGRALAREALGASAPMSHALLGVYDFQGGRAGYSRRLLAWLASARSGDVLMCHPSIGDMSATDHNGARMAEYAVLTAMNFPWTAPSGDAVVLQPLSRHVHAGSPWSKA